MIGRGVRQWLEQNSVDDAEDGGVRADAESEGENRNRGEAEILAHHAERVTRVGDESFEPEAAALLAAIFLDAFYRAELQRRLASRFIGRHSCGDVGGGLLLDVETQLVVFASCSPIFCARTRSYVHLNTPSFVSQCRQRIDAHRPSRRDVASQNGYACQQERYDNEG